MDFSETYRSSGPAPCFSPDGRFLATVVEYRLILREVETLRVVQLYPCLDRIDSIEWSCNSAYVLCGLHARAIVQIFSVDNPEWTCKIDEGPAGMQAVRWSPDGTAVLVVADFGIRITVWSLTDKKCTYLRGPKHPERGLAFSADGAHLAVLERAEFKDRVAVYDTRTWQQVGHFPLETADAAELAWSPDGGALAAWDSPLTYKVVVMDASSGARLAAYSAYGHDALGVKCVQWSPSGEMMAVGSYDRMARVLNHVTWLPLLECEHGPQVSGPTNVVVYKEELEGGSADQRSKYVIAQLPAPVPQHKPALDSAGPKLGVGQCAWSPDGQYLATVEDSSPSSVWVWDMAAMELGAVLLHEAPVEELAWGPRGCTLAMVGGGSNSTKVYLWTPQGASIVHIPLSTFQAHGCTWNATATTLLLRDRDSFCCAYMTA